MVNSSIKDKITTIKLNRQTKDRIDKLRIYKRETYDEILQNLLSILNLCKVNPEAAKRRLSLIDRKGKKTNQYIQQNQRKINPQIRQAPASSQSSAPRMNPQQARATRL